MKRLLIIALLTFGFNAVIFSQNINPLISDFNEGSTALAQIAELLDSDEITIGGNLRGLLESQLGTTVTDNDEYSNYFSSTQANFDLWHEVYKTFEQKDKSEARKAIRILLVNIKHNL